MNTTTTTQPQYRYKALLAKPSKVERLANKVVVYSTLLDSERPIPDELDETNALITAYVVFQCASDSDRNLEHIAAIKLCNGEVVPISGATMKLTQFIAEIECSNRGTLPAPIAAFLYVGRHGKGLWTPASFPKKTNPPNQQQRTKNKVTKQDTPSYLIRLRDSPAYLGMDRNRFNAEVRPYVDEAPMGKQGVCFRRHDLDEWAEEHFEEHGRPARAKGVNTWDRRKHLVSTNETGSGTSTSKSEVDEFARAVEQVTSEKPKDT